VKPATDVLGDWWVSTLPGAALLVTLILVNVLGEQVRDRLDPKLKVR
jgi:ABC-type dipeptide/oligopeptide/nickel transport system permease subunit